uniref:DNA-directed RNA polymerase n=1 Tax=viral metagenome TaxID=1070528 RepID=A0A6C0EUD6_9ZZZZ
MTSKTPSKIIGIQFSILSPEEIEKYSVAEITNKETYTGIKPKIGGLFDPRMGVLEPGMICPTDGQNYIDSPGYFGHIKLARPVFYIQYLGTIQKILRCVCIKCSKLLINKKANSNLLSYKPHERWDEVFSLSNKLTRCGQESENGCECLQPEKIKKEGFATLLAEWSRSKDAEKEKDEKLTMKLTPEIVLKIFKKITDEDVNFMGFSSIWSRPEWMVCQIFAVPPPSVRPSVKHDSQQRSEDDLTHIIINIIKYNNTLRDKLATKGVNSKVIDDWTSILQYYIATMVDNTLPGASPVTQRSGRALKSITERHKGKTGRVRGNLMGKRVDFSARSVITPDPELSITELGVPLKIAMNITKPIFVNETNIHYLTYLVKNGPDVYPGAKILEKENGDNISLRYVDRENIKLKVGDTVHRHMLNGDYVLFNRQPTLHRMSMMAHIVKVMKKGDTFRMNVADTKPYNADFDGDEMNMHMPQNDEAEMELKYLAAIRYQIISPASNKSIIGIFQDSLLGSYLFTREKIMFTRKEAMNLLAKTTKLDPSFFMNDKEYFSSFEVLSTILPPLSIQYKKDAFKTTDNYETSNHVVEIVNGVIKRGQLDKDTLGSGGRGLIQRINNDFSAAESQYFIDDLQAIITEYMKTTGFSVGISDLISNDVTNEMINEVIYKNKKEVANLIDQLHLGILENKSGRSNEEFFESQVNNILNKASNDAGKIGIEHLSKDNRFVTIVTSGSKGNTLNISQMISCLGQQNIDNKRIPYSFPNRTLPHFKQFDDSPVARGFVENSFISGLSPEELFFHAMGGRIGLIDTAVKTSQTGYIQRRLIKGLEDIYVSYDRTVRNNKNKIVQFSYGGTNFDTIHIENVKFDLLTDTIGNIYENYSYDYKKNILKLKFTKGAISRFNDQTSDLKQRVTDDIKLMIEGRNTYIMNISEYTDKNTIYLPISFKQITLNVKSQFNISSSTLSDITPMDTYAIIDKYYKELDHTYKPCYMFKLAYYYYLNPYKLVYTNNYSKEAIIFLMEKVVLMYKTSLVNPGEMVGLISAQSIGEPTTQMTLNTFHYAGVSSKSNVTRGVPRIEEILTLTDNLKNPSITVYLKKEDETNVEKAYEIISRIEHTKMKDIVLKTEIYYDPDELTTLVSADKQFMEQYNEFKDILEGCVVEEEDKNYNRWILRLTLDKTHMLEINITVEEVHYALMAIYEENISCFYNDLNDEELIFRIRLNTSKSKSKPLSLDQEDHIYLVKSFQDNLLNNIVLRGVDGINRVHLRKINNYMSYNSDTGDYDKKDICVLDTFGSNLLGVLSLDYIDSSRTFSNNIIETQNILGVEAARKCLFNETIDVIEFDSYINHHHIGILCDRMTCNKKMTSIFRHGINKDNIGPIAKATFEETTEIFLNAAKHGELDEMRGVSANVMCGQEGFYGTSSFSVYLNTIEMEKNAVDNDYEEEDEDIFEMMKQTDESCTVDQLRIQHNVISDIINIPDNEYEIDL